MSIRFVNFLKLCYIFYMKKNLKTKEIFVKSYLTTPFIYENYCSQIKELFNNISFHTFEPNIVINLDKLKFNYPLLYILNGSFNILYKDKVIKKVIPSKPYLIGETSFLKLIYSDKNFYRISQIYTNEIVEAIIIDLIDFNKYSVTLQEIIVENILINLFDKIIYMNGKLEKLSNIYNKINNYFIENSKYDISQLIEEIKKILNSSPLFFKKNKKTKNLIIDDIQNYLLNNKEDIYKRFYFLKKYIAPIINSINDDKLLFYIAKEGKWVKFHENEILCYEGEANNGCFYIIIKGGVDIIVNNTKINELNDTFLVGEMALIGNIKGNYPKRTATVKFNQESIAIIVKIDKFFKFSKQIKLKFTGTLILQMLGRLQSTNEEFINYLNKINHFLTNIEKSGEYSSNTTNLIRESIFSNENLTD